MFIHHFRYIVETKCLHSLLDDLLMFCPHMRGWKESPVVEAFLFTPSLSQAFERLMV